MSDSLLLDLLLRWESARERGENLSPEDLCPDDPERAAELRRRIDGLTKIADLAGVSPEPTRAGPTPPADPPNLPGSGCTEVQHFPPADPHATACPPSPGTPTAPSRLPRRFGGYELLEELGHGGMGVVYKARQFAPQRLVALKVIRAGELATEEDVHRFRQEADDAAHLEHPHIVPVYEVGEHHGLHFFTMKLVEGGSLNKHLERYQNDFKAAARLSAAAARAVHYAHQRQLLHRDLKPGNILLDAADQPHVADFGLAKRMEGDVAAMTRSNAIVGTPEYMAPEQARGEKQLTTAADVYALGGVLYALLAGRPPFQAGAPLDVLVKVVSEEPTPPSKVRPGAPRDLETICLKCLAKEPAKRYGSAEALAEDLERWLKGEPVRARPVGAVERAAKWARRKPALVAAYGLLLAVLLLVLAGGVIFWERERETQQEEQIAKDTLVTAKNRLYMGWKRLDLPELQKAKSEGDQARNNAKSAKVKQEATDFCTDAEQKLQQAKQDRDRFEQVLVDLLEHHDHDKWRKGDARLNELIGDHSKNPELYFYHGWALGEQRRLEESVEAYRTAIQLRPDYAVAWNNLGYRLGELGKLADAEDAYNKATELDPKYVEAWENLGYTRRRRNELAEAEEAYRKVIMLDAAPGWAYQLGRTLMQEAKFKEALDELQKASNRWPDKSEDWQQVQDQVQLCQRLLNLEPRLDAILEEPEPPARTAADQLDIAQLCAFKRLYAASARFHRDAFAKEPRYAESGGETRYYAACSAALAGCGQGEDADQLDKEARTLWRQQALEWLSADLTLTAKALNNAGPQDGGEIEQRVRIWQSDADLACVRDPDALAKLPEEERMKWRTFWADVADLRNKANAAR